MISAFEPPVPAAFVVVHVVFWGANCDASVLPYGICCHPPLVCLQATRKRVENGGCCGPAELMKFFSYTLTEYHRVVHLDTDVIVSVPCAAAAFGYTSPMYSNAS